MSSVPFTFIRMGDVGYQSNYAIMIALISFFEKMLLLHWRHLLRILSAWFFILLLRRGRLILLPTFLIGPLWWLYALAVSCGLQRARQLVVVGDGAVQQCCPHALSGLSSPGDAGGQWHCGNGL